MHFGPTRLIAATFLSQATGKNVYLKLETELPTGSFKVRGAFWALAQRMKRGAIREVVACSTGNHGAAVGAPGKEGGHAGRGFFAAQRQYVKAGGHPPPAGGVWGVGGGEAGA